jgi:hypothetical protein
LINNPQIQGFISQLDQILPQLAGILSSPELQSFKDKIIQFVLTGIASNTGFNGIKDQITQFVQQFLGSKALPRDTLDDILNTINSILPTVNNVVSVLSVLGGLFGKREVPAIDPRLDINALLSLINNPQIQAFISQLDQILPQLAGILSSPELQSFKDKIIQFVLTGIASNTGLNGIKDQVTQFIRQFLGSKALPRNTLDDILNTINSILPTVNNVVSVLSVLGGLFGKRDVERSINLQQVLSFLPVDKLVQLVQVVNNIAKIPVAQVLAKLRKLLEQFLPAYQGRINFDELANQVLNNLNTLLSSLSTSIFQSISNLG